MLQQSQEYADAMRRHYGDSHIYHAVMNAGKRQNI